MIINDVNEHTRTKQSSLCATAAEINVVHTVMIMMMMMMMNFAIYNEYHLRRGDVEVAHCGSQVAAEARTQHRQPPRRQLQQL